jgi:hypothetical protein
MDASRPSRTDGLAGPQKASPAWVERLAPLDLVVVAVVLDHLAPVVEAQHHHARVGEFLAFPGPAGAGYGREICGRRRGR